MGKSNRRKKQRKARRKPSLGLDLKAFQNPFAHIPVEERIWIFATFGKDQAEKFSSTSTAIRERLSHVDPLAMLACLTAYGITDSIDSRGLISRKSKHGLLPAHVELVQMISLTLPADSISSALLQSEDVQWMFDTLPEWTNQFQWKRLGQLGEWIGEQEKGRLAVQEQMRAATQMVRNWGFYDQVKRLGLELLAPLEARFEAEQDYRFSDLNLIFDHMFTACLERLNAHLDRLRPMMTAKTLREAARAYLSAIPDLKGSPESFEESMRERRASLEAAKFMMLAHADLRLPDCYTFTADEVATAIGRPTSVVEAALHAVSYRFGDLAGSFVEHAFMSNPVWTKPVINIGEGRYFCPLPQTFFAFLFETVLTLLRSSPALRQAYDKRRSDYLEEKTQELFEKAFPEGKQIPNYKWKSPDGTQEFESDLMVGFDSILLLIEAKSGRVSPQARRGAADSLKDIIEGLLIEPSRQSRRLEEAIMAAKSGDRDRETFRQAFPLPLDRIRRIIRLSVTLEDVGFMHTNITALKDVGYVPANVEVAPAATLADLEIVFDILQTPLERIHYWLRRNVWERSADYTADEIDLLGVYLKTGLNVGDIHENVRLVLVGESKPIDEYYEALRNGFTRTRPTYRATKWWREMLERLEARKPNRWIEAGIALLSAGHGQQVEIERRAKKLVSTVGKQRERAASHNALIFVASVNTHEVIALLALMGSQVPERFRLMENIASQAFAEYSTADQCVVIMIDVDQPGYPYDSLAHFTR